VCSMAAWKPTCGLLDNALGLGIYEGLKSEEQAQVFRTLLYEAAGVSHLRQLYAVFGVDIMLKFFDLFAGVTFEVPSREKIEIAIRDTRIFFLMNRAKVGQRAVRARELAGEFELSTWRVKRVNAIILRAFLCCVFRVDALISLSRDIFGAPSAFCHSDGSTSEIKTPEKL